jgi:hypothetical protein
MDAVVKILLLSLLFFSDLIAAVEVQGLYEAEVMTQSQSREDRNAAIKAALEIVLEKVLAGEEILQDTAVKIALTDPGQYVTQYQYSLIPSDKDPQSAARVMRVIFDENALLSLLKSSELGIWSAMRDETLVWLVVDRADKRQFYDEIRMPEISAALDKASRNKGLPLIFPLMDLEEQQNISVNDVLSAYSERLLEISARYDSIAILTGRIQQKNKCWIGEWAFYFDDDINQWAQACSHLDQVLLSGMQGAYDQLSKYYAVKPETLEIDTIILKVSGINGMTNLTRVTDYLSSLSMSEAVNWLKVEAGVNLYKVKFSGSQADLQKKLDLGRVLDPINKGISSGNELEYRLLH